jgi:hypothetical protein
VKYIMILVSMFDGKKDCTWIDNYQYYSIVIYHCRCNYDGCQVLNMSLF